MGLSIQQKERVTKALHSMGPIPGSQYGIVVAEKDQDVIYSTYYEY